ncbi:unnamed protein product [Closterium sp. NIES-64]|nr:unnamed protein product [Closterium sp. NIES-64]
MRIGVALRSDGVATFGEGTKVGSSGRGNRDKGGKHGGSGSSSDTNSGRWGQGKGKAGVLDFPWGSKGMAPRGLCRGCWDEGHAWQRCPHRPKGGIPAFLKRGGRGSSGKAQVADEEEQDDKAEAVVGEAVAAVGEEQPRERWWIDSGASHNFTLYTSDFKTRNSFPHEASRALGPLDEVHMDLWGPVRTPSVGGAVYVLSLIDDFTRRVCSFPLPNKESATVAKVLRQWHKDVELECGRKLKAIRSDRGGEFLGEAVKAWKVEFGTKTQVTHSALPASITPMEAWSGQKPHVGMARIWEQGLAHAGPSLMRIRIARDVDFLENVMWKDWDKAKGYGELLQDAAKISQLLLLPLSPPSATVDDAEMPPSSLPPAPLRVSVQQPTPLQQLSGTSVLGIQSGTGGEEVGGDAGVVEGMLCLAREVEGVALAGVSTGDVPRTLVEALRGPEGPAWKAGAEKEVNAMRTMGIRNGTWSTEEGAAADVKVY